MSKNKLSVRILAVILIITGLYGLNDQYEWITNDSYRQTINALGSPRDVFNNWAIVAISAVMLLMGFLIFILSLKQKKQP